MKIEDQVTSLELSKKLKELIVKQESYFYWCWDGYDHHDKKLRHGKYDSNNLDYHALYSAFNAQELFEFIPNTLILDENDPMSDYRFYMTRGRLYPTPIPSKFDNYFLVNYYQNSFEINDISKIPFFMESLIKEPIYDLNLSNALARLLIILIEKGWIKLYEPR